MSMKNKIKKIKVNIAINPRVWELISELAIAESRSRSNMVEVMLTKELKRLKVKV